MRAMTGSRKARAVELLVCISLAMVSLASAAHDPVQTIPEPGFRPPSHDVQVFLEDVGEMSVDVLPSMVRRIDRTAHSFASQQQIVDFLNQNGIATARALRHRIDLGALAKPSQWELFQQGLSAVAESAQGRDAGADYTLVMEILVPGDEAVFGVEVYIVDAQGRNAFSFLLNSHHQMFAEAQLKASGSSEAARQKLIGNATQLGLLALQAQIQGARECLQRETIAVPRSRAGLLDDFDAPLAAGADEWGTPLGYSAFSGPDTTVSFAATPAHPPRAGMKEGNQVLRLDLDVSSWGGVIHRFAHSTAGRWIPQDLHLLDGAQLLVPRREQRRRGVLRYPRQPECLLEDGRCRTVPLQILVRHRGGAWAKLRFQDLAREDVFNGAPDDGLDLARVHGWGLGTSDTGGPVTFFLDDFRLLDDASEAIPPDAVCVLHEGFVETRLDEDVSRIEFSAEGDGRMVVERVLGLMCACDRLSLDRGFEYFRVDGREVLSGQRARFGYFLRAASGRYSGPDPACEAWQRDDAGRRVCGPYGPRTTSRFCQP